MKDVPDYNKKRQKLMLTNEHILNGTARSNCFSDVLKMVCGNCVNTQLSKLPK
jgi:hypothetical protein